MKHFYRLATGLFFSFCVAFTAVAAAVPQANQEPAVQVPVLMYHSLYKGGGNAWTISPTAFEQDLQYLADNGYQAVSASDLVAFVDEGKPLPEKPVMLTFDDGYYNFYTQAFPLLKQYNMKAVVSVIGEVTDTWSTTDERSEKYGYLSWQHLGELLASGLVEISNHTQSLHNKQNGRNGCCRKPGEDQDRYCALLKADIDALQQSCRQNCGITPLCFAYPFGSRCPEALAVLKEMGMRVTLSCYSGNNPVTVGNPDCLYDMRRNNRTASQSAGAILQKLERRA